MENIIQQNNGIIDYIEFVHPDTLEFVPELKKGDRILLAVKIENTRLIDNMEL